ncbi:hypothetical protein EJB05_49882 [Eragrostis curvula]|uniref:DNA-(apurinic or apyrimidinic site) lyase n=1 Tax=Eragrostis curvula TaxID=38414 RepID=A0A5J9T6Q4_9POAL|nr:hypothetical protein EJB05_49882 [Eragrostis curvula]
MPELPEVEAARRALEEHCVGKRIVRCAAADDAKVMDGVAPARLEAALVGRTIAAARRKGKNLWLALDSPPHPTFQFGFNAAASGMAGAIYIKGVELSKYKRSAVNTTEEWPSKYSKLFVQMDDGLEFSFTDKRRFAKIRLLDNPEAAPPISELGPDALFEPMKLDDFMQLLSRKNVPIKALLLDQSFISGIGNWVADEVLYQARIHPMQTASKMSKSKCETLHQCIKEVIEKSLEVGADSSQFPENWIFHYREKKHGQASVDGKKIDFITVGGRTSAYVPELQKLDGVDVTASRSKRSKDKDNDDETDLGKGKMGAKNANAADISARKARTVDNEANEEDQEGDEDAKLAKRGRKKTTELAKSSSKKVSHALMGSEEAADAELEAKPGKRRGSNQASTEMKTLPKKDHDAGPAKRPHRKARLG